MRIYLDVDDTLSHFREHAVEMGVPRWEGSWYTTPRETWTPEQCAIQDATNNLMRTKDFWETMPIVDGAHELIAAASFHGPVYLLTALPASLSGEPDVLEMVRRTKIQFGWQKLHVPPERVLVVNRVDKMRYAFDHFAQVSNVLIDDAIQTCEAWADANGVAFHVPDVASHGLADAIDFIKGF